MCFGADAVSYLYDHLSTRILSLITAACAAIGHGPIALYAALIYKADVGASLVVIVCDHDLGSAPPSEPGCPLSAARFPKTGPEASSRLLAEPVRYINWKSSGNRIRGGDSRVVDVSMMSKLFTSQGLDSLVVTGVALPWEQMK